MSLGRFARAIATTPPGTGTPAALSTVLAMSFCMASAEASTPEWRIGNAEDFQQALQRAVLARTAVQHVERDIGLEFAQRRGDVAGDVEAADAIAAEPLGASAQALPERSEISRSADQPPISTATCFILTFVLGVSSYPP